MAPRGVALKPRLIPPAGAFHFLCGALMMCWPLFACLLQLFDGRVYRFIGAGVTGIDHAEVTDTGAPAPGRCPAPVIGQAPGAGCCLPTVGRPLAEGRREAPGRVTRWSRYREETGDRGGKVKHVGGFPIGTCREPSIMSPWLRLACRWTGVARSGDWPST